LAEAKAFRAPTSEETQQLWRKTTSAYLQWVIAHHTRELKAQTVISFRGQMYHRLVLLREAEMRKQIHRIRRRLGEKFLDRFPVRIVEDGRSIDRMSSQLSGRPTGISNSPPAPSA
jgi:hypothetical protein